jgi:hypothetical protein
MKGKATGERTEDEVKTLFRNETWHVYVKKTRLGKRLVVESKTLLDYPAVHAGSQRSAFISYGHPEQIPEYVKREVRKHLMQEWKPFLRGRIGKRTVKRRD